MESARAGWKVLALRARHVLQLRRRHGDDLEICVVPRTDLVAARLVGSAVTRRSSQEEISLGVDLLSKGEDGEDFSSTDEPGGPRTPQEHRAR